MIDLIIPTLSQGLFVVPLGSWCLHHVPGP